MRNNPCGRLHDAGAWRHRPAIYNRNSSVAALTVRLGRELYSVTAETSISEKERLNAVSNVVKFTGDGVRNLLNDAGYGVDGDEDFELGYIPPRLTDDESKAKAF